MKKISIISMIIFVFVVPAQAEEIAGLYIGSNDYAKLFLLPEREKEQIDAIGCISHNYSSKLTPGVIYNFNFNEGEIFSDPDYENDEDFNKILFSKYCKF